MRNHKIDERKDKIQRIKKAIDRTQYNMEFASNLIDASTDENHKQSLKAQNDRREDYIDTMQDELEEKIGKKKNKK